MSEETVPGEGTRAESAGGCFLAAAGALAGLLFWAPRAAYSIDGGFEAHARDLSVVFVDLPLILLGATVLPLFTWLLMLRPGRWWSRRVWPGVLVALCVLLLFLYGVDAWWHPRQGPDPGYGPGL